MTEARVKEILSNAHTRSGAIRIFGQTNRVDLSEAKHLEVIQIHADGHSIDEIIQGIEATGARPLYVESIPINPGALSFRSFRDTFGDIDPNAIPKTYVRVFIDNKTGKDAMDLSQAFQDKVHGPVVMSWSSIGKEQPGLLCYRTAGRNAEFGEFFREDLDGLTAT